MDTIYTIVDATRLVEDHGTIVMFEGVAHCSGDTVIFACEARSAGLIQRAIADGETPTVALPPEFIRRRTPASA